MIDLPKKIAELAQIETLNNQLQAECKQLRMLLAALIISQCDGHITITDERLVRLDADGQELLVSRNTFRSATDIRVVPFTGRQQVKVEQEQPPSKLNKKTKTVRGKSQAAREVFGA
jgi:hypothetical protein